MELQASAALQTLASVKKQKQGKAVKAAAVTEEEAEEEEEQMEEAAAEEGSAVSGGTAEAEVAAEAGTGE